MLKLWLISLAALISHVSSGWAVFNIRNGDNASIERIRINMKDKRYFKNLN
jgi:hypothetical protein